MILIDTSVLIDYFRGNENRAVRLFDNVLQNEISYGISPFVYLEILQGARNEKEFEILNEYLCTVKFYHLNDKLYSYSFAAMLNLRCRQHGVTVRSTIDLLIATTAMENNLYLLHNDRDFDHIASVITDLKIFDGRL